MSFYSISIGHHRFDIIRKFLNDQISLSLFSRRLKMSFSMLKPCRKILLSTIAQYFFYKIYPRTKCRKWICVSRHRNYLWIILFKKNFQRLHDSSQHTVIKLRVIGEQFTPILSSSINLLPIENDWIRFLTLFCEKTSIYTLFF